jgi:hypothetical protein
MKLRVRVLPDRHQANMKKLVQAGEGVSAGSLGYQDENGRPMNLPFF